MSSIAELDLAHVWHPYTQHGLAPHAVPIVRARGALLYEESGRSIIDAIASWWVTLHGHAHPVITAAIAAQAERLEQVIFAGFTHEPAAALASELVGHLPSGLTRVFYSDNGSTAVEVALKLALQYWSNRGQPRTRIVALEHAYHGDTFGAMSSSARGVFTAPYATHLFDVVRLPGPGPVAGDSETLLALDRLLEDDASSIAAVIVEPRLQAAGGMRVWHDDVVRGIRERTARHGVLLIADEVLTGFGRTGPMFACTGAGIVPDVILPVEGTDRRLSAPRRDGRRGRTVRRVPWNGPPPDVLSRPLVHGKPNRVRRRTGELVPVRRPMRRPARLDRRHALPATRAVGRASVGSRSEGARDRGRLRPPAPRRRRVWWLPRPDRPRAVGVRARSRGAAAAPRQRGVRVAALRHHGRTAWAGLRRDRRISGQLDGRRAPVSATAGATA